MCQVLDLVTRGVVKVSSCYRLTGEAILIITFVASDGNKRALDIDCQCMNEHEVKNITPFELKLYLLKEKKPYLNSMPLMAPIMFLPLNIKMETRSIIKYPYLTLLA